LSEKNEEVTKDLNQVKLTTTRQKIWIKQRMTTDEFDITSEESTTESIVEVTGSITSIPMIAFYQKRYANSLANNDIKAAKLFKQYETTEAIKRFQNELLSIKSGLVAETTLTLTLGKSRQTKHKGFNNWAKLMLLWLAEQRK
jgi:hypothetical protein